MKFSWDGGGVETTITNEDIKRLKEKAQLLG